MKKICFLEMEGILTPFGDYFPDEKKVRAFLSGLKEYSSKVGLELFLISGHNDSVANQKLCDNKLDDFFDSKHFLCVNEKYIAAKSEMDEQMHRESLAKDEEFLDTYFKQVIISDLLKAKGFSPKDALLLADDVWVDGYYTIRFSKIDFAIFGENVLDRGKRIEKIDGLVYFSLEMDLIKALVENFPQSDNSILEKYVFESMKKVLVGDDVVNAIKNGLIKKQESA